ncbi:MAG TPA: type II toxin-antitoxin system VapC family toxin [Pirellulales bacterium]|nr:type II toxin-antitoxin system VapC family toxin [Pirellulales bacterium]
MDTSVVARLANVNDALHTVAGRALLHLHRNGEAVHITPQVLIEFRSVATRPIYANGLGLPAVDAEAHALLFVTRFPLLADTPDVYPAWKALVEAVGVIGKQVHDARLVAVCHAHKVTHLLTFNVAHFRRMSAFGPGLIVVDPATV